MRVVQKPQVKVALLSITAGNCFTCELMTSSVSVCMVTDNSPRNAITIVCLETGELRNLQPGLMVTPVSIECSYWNK